MKSERKDQKRGLSANGAHPAVMVASGDERAIPPAANPKEVVGALVAPVAGIAAAVGGLAATGVLGRVERNEAHWFKISLLLVTAGGLALLVWASLRGQANTRSHVGTGNRLTRRLQRVRELIVDWGFALGTTCAAAGIAIAVLAAVATASQTERPTILARVDPVNRVVHATVRADNVPSDRRLVLVVDGLEPSRDGETYEPTTVYQAYVGPDGNGKINIPVSLQLYRYFSAVGIKAYIARQHADAGSAGQICTPYPRRVSTTPDARNDVGPGCVIVTLSHPKTAGKSTVG